MGIILGAVQQQVAPPSGIVPEVISVTASQWTENAFAHNVSMPTTTSSGELLLVLISFDAYPTVTVSGFTSIYEYKRGTACTQGLFAKIADGTEGGTTVNFSTSTSEQAAAQVFRIRNWGTVIAESVAYGTAVQATSGTYSPPSLTTGWGSVPTLWIVFVSTSGTGTSSSIPSNYGDYLFTGATVATYSSAAWSCRRHATAASESPGTWSFSSASDGIINTIAVKGVSS